MATENTDTEPVEPVEATAADTAKATFVERYEAKLAESKPVEVDADADAEVDDDDEVEPTAEVEVESAEPVAEDEADLDAAIDAALDAGMTEEEIQGYSSAAALKDAASRASKSSDDSDGDEQSATETMDWDYLDPDVKEALTAFKSESEAAAKSMQAEITSLKKMVEEQASAAGQQRFAQYVDSLDKPQQKLLDASGRRQVREEMEVLRDGYRSRGKGVPDEQELFTKAFNSTFTNDIKKIDADRIKRQVKSRQSQMSVPPTRRDSMDYVGDPLEVAKINFVQNYEAALASKG